jgi:hypothetical protein
MNAQQFFLLISLLALLIILGLILFARFRTQQDESLKLTPIAGLAFASILAGIFFGSERWLGYGLIGLGVILSVIDIVIKLRKGS